MGRDSYCMTKTLFMETTQIDSEKTISEIQSLLVQHKATSILMEYTAGKISSVCFRIEINGNLIPFRLPCRHEPIQKVLASRTRDYKQAWSKEMREKVADKYEDQARRVAWRQILRWVQAQLALVETGMVKVEEVFLPYAQLPTGETIFEKIETSNYLLLGNS